MTFYRLYAMCRRHGYSRINAVKKAWELTT